MHGHMQVQSRGCGGWAPARLGTQEEVDGWSWGIIFLFTPSNTPTNVPFIEAGVLTQPLLAWLPSSERITQK